MSKPRWYVIDRNGRANLAWNKETAEVCAAEFDKSYPNISPHRAVQLVDAAELEEKKVEHEIMYARLSDELKASQRDLNTALARIAVLEVELEQAWLVYGRATSLACALNN